LKNLPVRDADEEIFELREKYERVHAEWKIGRSEHDALQREIDHKQSLLQKYEFEMQKQVETVAYLNNEVRFFFPKSSCSHKCAYHEN
jgi:FtsZ-binding cell division protein ZapB